MVEGQSATAPSFNHKIGFVQFVFLEKKRQVHTIPWIASKFMRQQDKAD